MKKTTFIIGPEIYKRDTLIDRIETIQGKE